MKGFKKSQSKPVTKRQRRNEAARLQNERFLGRLVERMRIDEDSSQESNNISGERGGDSFNQSLSATKLKKEQSRCSSQFCNRAPAGPRVVSSSQESNSLRKSHEVCECAKISRKSKKIAKARPSAPRIQRPRRATTPPTARTARAARENHRKYTVKTVSNFLRKELKKAKFNFNRLESKYNNKRGSRIYFNSSLLELKHLLGPKLQDVIQRYLEDLDRRILEEMSKQERFGWTERTQRYIEDFEKAKIATKQFMKGKYLRSIKTFFGTGKEQYYLEESLRYFTERKDQLKDYTLMVDEDEDIFDVLAI